MNTIIKMMAQEMSGIRTTALAVMVFFTPVVAVPAFAQLPEPVWMFNFKDTFLDIACIDAQRAVVVGDRGTILATHGIYKNLWAPRDSTTTEMLTSVSFVNEKLGWAAGHGGIILHTRDGGETWEVQRESSSRNLPLFDIQFVTEEVGYASGAYDTFLKSEDGGKSWKSLPTGNDVIYNGLLFHDPDNGFLLGEFGSLLRTGDGGQSWEQMNTGDFEGSLFGITFLSRQNAIAHGISGKILVSNDGGENWADVPTGTEEALFRSAVDGNKVAIVGKSGIVLLSEDGGRSFTRKYEPDNYSLAGVCAHAQLGFVAVGEFGKIVNVEALPDE